MAKNQFGMADIAHIEDLTLGELGLSDTKKGGKLIGEGTILLLNTMKLGEDLQGNEILTIYLYRVGLNKERIKDAITGKKIGIANMLAADLYNAELTNILSRTD